MKKITFVLMGICMFLINSCGSSSKTTTTVDPHSAAHSKVHQDYIDEKEKEINDKNSSEELENSPSDMGKYISKVEGLWLVTEVSDIVIDPHSFKFKRPSLDFNTSKQIAVGHDGCNSFNISFKVSGNTISFDQMLSTLMACNENVEITDAVRKSLSGKNLTFKIENSKMFLTDGNIEVLILLQQNY